MTIRRGNTDPSKGTVLSASIRAADCYSVRCDGLNSTSSAVKREIPDLARGFPPTCDRYSL